MRRRFDVARFLLEISTKIVCEFARVAELARVATRGNLSTQSDIVFGACKCAALVLATRSFPWLVLLTILCTICPT